MNKITFQSAFLLFRMKIVLDLEGLIEEHINKWCPYSSSNNKWISVVHKLQIYNPNETAKVVDNGA